MNPYLQDPDLTLYNGDVLEVLAGLPDESVQMCVTSPPYWGLRDYGTGVWEGGDSDCDHLAPYSPQTDRAHGKPTGTRGEQPNTHRSGGQFKQTCGKCGASRTDNQLGLEATPDEYVAKMVDVFREVRRVLRRDGTLWLNLGDSYAHGQPGGGCVFENGRTDGRTAYEGDKVRGRQKVATLAPGLKPKDLILMPARVALALQADGWWLRSEITWCKPNPMPESVTDRPTQATEKVFLFSRSPRYFYDAEAVREDGSGLNGGGFSRAYAEAQPGHGAMRLERPDVAGRNLRNWWEIATEPYPEAHFATYPQELVRRCVLAGTSERGCCPECGAAWVREVERIDQGYDGSRYGERAVEATGGATSGGTARSTLGSSNGKLTGKTETRGWRPSCECALSERELSGEVASTKTRPSLSESAPCTVLDPFFGSGTTGLVARKHGRRTIGIELSSEYCGLAARRLSQLSLLAEPA